MKLLKISKSAWIAFLIAIILSFFMAATSHAQSSDAADKYGVKFPVSELGGCKDLSSCKSFCEDPVNAEACISFAKSKGFYKEPEAQKEIVLEKAKQTLGCDSIETCKTFCQVQANFDKCDSFARQNNLGGGHTEDPTKKEIVDKAKQVLGCDSYTSCASFCSDTANKQKCSEFAKEVGLKGGENKVGPGGCSSESTCKSFCSDPVNFQVCKGFVSSSGGNFQGPGGCDSEQSCRDYCKDHGAQCPGMRVQGTVGAAGGFDPQEMCNRTPSCSWNNNTCNCNAAGTPNTPQTFDPAKECVKYSGCSFVNNSCQCASRYETSGNTNSKDQQEAQCKAGGGTCGTGSTSSFCNCQGYKTPQYTPTPNAGTLNATPGSKSYAPCPNTSCSQGYSPDPGASCACRPSPQGPPPGTAPGSSMSREQQESVCRSGGGTCTGTGDFCNCQGYKSSSTSTTNMEPSTACKNAGGSWTGSACQMPSSGSSGGSTVQYQGTMSRDSQEAGCRACNGSCNWSGDSCNCQCGGSTTPPPPAPAPAPAPAAPAPAPEPAPAPLTTPPPPPPAVQGVAAVKSLFDYLLDLFK